MSVMRTLSFFVNCKCALVVATLPLSQQFLLFVHHDPPSSPTSLRHHHHHPLALLLLFHLISTFSTNTTIQPLPRPPPSTSPSAQPEVKSTGCLILEAHTSTVNHLTGNLRHLDLACFETSDGLESKFSASRFSTLDTVTTVRFDRLMASNLALHGRIPWQSASNVILRCFSCDKEVCRFVE